MPRPKGSKNKPKIIQQVEQEAMEKQENYDKFIVFGKPDIGEQEIQAVTNVMRSGWIGTGKISRRFEEEFAQFMGGGYAIAVSSATMGLQLALRVSNVGEGKEVITTPLTFAATINAIIREGAKPVFVDVNEKGCIDTNRIKEVLTERTRAIIPVHYTGTACDMGHIDQIARQYDLKVIEDAAHSFGGHYMTKTIEGYPSVARKQGSIGDFGVFSFYATKNITCGEGGMVFTKYGDMAERIKVLANQGQSTGAWARYTSSPIMPYEVSYDGYKGNLPDVLAAIGLAQLRRWNDLRERRAKIWKIYEDSFGLKDDGHSMHLYTTKIKNRDFVRQRLYELGIGTGVHYTPIHLEPGFKFLGYKKGDFPLAERIGDETISLPIGNAMTEEDAIRVVRAMQIIKESK